MAIYRQAARDESRKVEGCGDPFPRSHGRDLQTPQHEGEWVLAASGRSGLEQRFHLLARADKNWQGLINDPDWKKAKAESEVNGVLVEDKTFICYFMDPTTFSPLQ
jgi:hypothetical protein